MNAVEIEEAVSSLALEEFDPIEFPYKFLIAFGNKNTTIKKLRTGTTNKSDRGGVLQRNNIHIATCEEGEVDITLNSLKESQETKKGKAKFILSTDGKYFSSEDLLSGETIACEYKNFADYFGFFLPLAGISTISQIKENSIDIKATGRLNKLYVELLKNNPDLDSSEKREEMNHFMARLIFCFFAEDTGIFGANLSFTKTIEQISDQNSRNTSEIIQKIFCVMDIPNSERKENDIPKWAINFPYVNGGLFTKNVEVPYFSKIARSYLIHIGNLDWQKINPDIFGSMIQVVAEEEERGSLGMHYTSVPNILKLLNPLFLNNIRKDLENSKGNKRKLIFLRNRISKIRVFDPACGSGNFLVIAYKELRKIEDYINREIGELGKKSNIPLTNFRGIEIRSFSCEIARLALIIAEYQCNVYFLGQKEAFDEFLPLHENNWITCGNSLRINWEEICPPTDKKSTFNPKDLFDKPSQISTVGFENKIGEIYVCGNPPYIGSRNQTKEQKNDIKLLLSQKVKSSALLDYVFGWIEKASEYFLIAKGDFAFVTTNSVTQGIQVPIYWPYLFSKNLSIIFARLSFLWSNNAAKNAGVTCVIIGIGKKRSSNFIFEEESCREVNIINPYLLPSETTIVQKLSEPISNIGKMYKGNLPGDGNHLTLSQQEKNELIDQNSNLEKIILPLYGAQEFIRGLQRYCLWIDDQDLPLANENEFIKNRIELVYKTRLNSKDPSYNSLINRPHQFRDRKLAKDFTILVPTISSERREYLPIAVFGGCIGTTNQSLALYDESLWNMSLLSSKMHLVWIATVCGKLKTDYRYSNVLGWNTFPVPNLTDNNKKEMNKSAENILLVRESYYPDNLSKLYDPEIMPDDLKAAHEYNDELIERIYIGRRFKNDTERLEKLFDLYIHVIKNKKVKIKSLH